MTSPSPPPPPEDGGPDVYEQLRTLPLGTHVRIRIPGGRQAEGWVLPADALSSPRTLKLKVASGYNIGIKVEAGMSFEVLPGPPWGEARAASEEGPLSPRGLPRGPAAESTVAILATGGTIASRIDYTTGGVHPVREPKDPEALYPGITRGGPVEVRAVAEILSEDMTPEVWSRLAREVLEEFRRGVRGVVVTHGTDTLTYTAAALAFQLRDLPGPVVLVGAQRSIDRPSSDGVENIRGAVRIAREADLGEVVVVMHRGPSDDALAVHRGTRVRKMHSTRRDAFRTLNGPPLGFLDPTGVHLQRSHRHRSSGPPTVEEHFGDGAALLWMHPGLSAERAEAHVGDCSGIVLAGTGMGHVAADHVPWIRRAIQRGSVVGMTTQCLEGEVDPYVYSRGRELLQAGVVYLGDMSPETAYVKMLWALGRSKDPAQVRRALLEDRAGECETMRPLQTEPRPDPSASEGP